MQILGDQDKDHLDFLGQHLLSWGLSHLQGPRSRSVLPVVPALMPEALTWAWRTGWRELLCGALPRPSSLPTLLCTESSNRPQTNSNSSQDEKRSKGPTSPLCLLLSGTQSDIQQSKLTHNVWVRSVGSGPSWHQLQPQGLWSDPCHLLDVTQDGFAQPTLWGT